MVHNGINNVGRTKIKILLMEYKQLEIKLKSSNMKVIDSGYQLKHMHIDVRENYQRAMYNWRKIEPKSSLREIRSVYRTWGPGLEKLLFCWVCYTGIGLGPMSQKMKLQ